MVGRKETSFLSEEKKEKGEIQCVLCMRRRGDIPIIYSVSGM